jgi:proton-dependent oligopeptide transporter, POT family
MSAPTAAAPTADGPKLPGGTFLGHPRALYLLFFTEMWERMSYYGMRALLVLYLTDKVRGGFGWSKAEALSLYGTYTGLVYLTPLFGGIIADQLLGQRRSVVIGGTLMMIGHFLMAVPGVPAFYAAIAFLIAGNGMFKPNISTMVGQLYRAGDPRRDGAFTIFYMGINIGAFLSSAVCGTLGEKYGWDWGFGSAGVGMLIGLVLIIAFGKMALGDVGLRANKKDKAELASNKAAAAQQKVATAALTREETHRIIVIIVLLVFVVFFWAAFEQAGGLMNLYTDEKVDRFFFGFQVPTTWFQAFNPIFIVVLAPVFAGMWTKLGNVQKDPSIPLKMAFGLLLLSAGFVFMLGASKQAEAAGKAALFWVVAAYLFHTMGELCLSPVGLSMVTKLAPARIGSLLMGTWFLANAIANKLAGVIGGYAEQLGEFTLFLGIVIATAAAGIVLAVLSPLLKKMMHGADEVQSASPKRPEPQGGPAVAA